MSLRRKRWEEWKRHEVEACPPKERKAYKKMLDDIPMPTLEDERRMRKIREDVERVLGEEPKRRKGHG